MNKRAKLFGWFFGSLTGLACLLIVAMVAIIIGNIVWHGHARLNWEFISTSPRAGMTEGGILPAIVGTFSLVMLMTIAVVPLGVAVSCTTVPTAYLLASVGQLGDGLAPTLPPPLGFTLVVSI